MICLNLRPAARYTYNGETVIDICRTQAGLAEHLEHLHANGYADAHPVTATEDGEVVVVDGEADTPLPEEAPAVTTIAALGYLDTQRLALQQSADGTQLRIVGGDGFAPWMDWEEGHALWVATWDLLEALGANPF